MKAKKTDQFLYQFYNGKTQKIIVLKFFTINEEEKLKINLADQFIMIVELKILIFHPLLFFPSL